VDGGAADALIANLRARQLSFPVEESGCLGACGMGTMVAIDYHDGSANLVVGLDQTLTELGISGIVQEEGITTNNDNVLSFSTVANSNIQAVSAVSIGMEDLVPSSNAPTAQQQEQVAPLVAESKVSKKDAETIPVSVEPIQCSTPQPPRHDTLKPSDARDRMRADAAKQVASATTNPWANMAGYLAKKAGEKLFGE
jgi:hypothetical protein